MKAIVQAKYGSPDDLSLQDVSCPISGVGEVLVRVCAASVHPGLRHVVVGRPYVLRLMGAGFSRLTNPIPGTDMSGIVEAVGKNVTRFRVPSNLAFSACRRALKPGGRYVLIGHEKFGAAGHRVLGLIPRMLGLMIAARFIKQLRSPSLRPPTREEAMAVLRELLESGAITPVIDRAYPLSETRAAFRHMIEDPTVGKVIIRMALGQDTH